MKLTLLGVIVIGVVATFLAAFSMWGFGIRPTGTMNVYLEEYIEKCDAEIAKERIAKQRVETAKAIVAKSKEDWQRYESRYGLPSEVIDFMKPRQYMAVQAWTLPSKLGKSFVDFGKSTKGVDFLSVPKIGKLPPDPNAIIDQYFNGASSPVLVAQFDMGGQIARGSFPALLEHYRNWNNTKNFLVLVDNLRFEGTTPNLVGTYTATAWVLPRGGNKLNNKPVPHTAADTGAAGGAGGGPGVGRGMNPYARPSSQAPVAPGSSPSAEPSDDLGAGGKGGRGGVAEM